MRQVYIDAWRKKQHGEVLEPMEAQIAAVIVRHPEYQSMLEDNDVLSREFGIEDSEANPFLHMSMHITIEEQIGTDRPAGIRAIYQKLLNDFQDSHTLEHAMMNCLGPCLWKAQQTGSMPDESEYLECVRRIKRRRYGR